MGGEGGRFRICEICVTFFKKITCDRQKNNLIVQKMLSCKKKKNFFPWKKGWIKIREKINVNQFHGWKQMENIKKKLLHKKK